MNHFTRRLLLALLLGVLVYAGFVIFTGYHRLARSLLSFNAWTFLAAIGLSSLNYAIRFFKWEYYLARLQVRGVAKLDSALVFLSGFVLTVTPGKVGEVFKSAVLAKTHGIPIARTAPIVVAERLTDVVGVAGLIVVCSTGFAGGLPWAAAGALAVASCVALILWQKPALFGIRWLKSREKRPGSLAPKLEQAFVSLRIVAAPAALLIPALLSLIGWGLEGVALVLLIRGFSEEVPMRFGVFFYSTATLAGALIPVPGGLGVVEAMIEEQLVRLGGIAAGPATAAMILVRFATLWWAVALGFLALFLIRLRHPELSRQREDDIVAGEQRGGMG